MGAAEAAGVGAWPPSAWELPRPSLTAALCHKLDSLSSRVAMVDGIMKRRCATALASWGRSLLAPMLASMEVSVRGASHLKGRGLCGGDTKLANPARNAIEVLAAIGETSDVNLKQGSGE